MRCACRAGAAARPARAADPHAPQCRGSVTGALRGKKPPTTHGKNLVRADGTGHSSRDTAPEWNPQPAERSPIMRLDEHRVVVTGAGRDFGRSLAISLAELGAEVFLAARSLDAVERVREEIRGEGGSAHAFTCDLGVPASVAAFAAAVSERTDRIDVLVNNGAPYLQTGGLTAADDEQIVDTIGAGATGTVLAVKHF